MWIVIGSGIGMRVNDLIVLAMKISLENYQNYGIKLNMKLVLKLIPVI